jgi:PAS domain S-box-containing protein
MSDAVPESPNSPDIENLTRHSVSQSTATPLAQLISGQPPQALLPQEILQDILDCACASIARFRFYPQRSSQRVEMVYRSAGCSAVFGYTAAEFAANPKLWQSRVLREDLVQVIKPSLATIAAGLPGTVEYRFRHKAGHLCWIGETFTAYWSEAEGCWLVTVVEVDITERQQAEVALQESEHRFRTLVENMPGAVFRDHGEPPWQPTYLSEEVSQICGYPASDFENHRVRTWYSLIHPEDLDRMEAEIDLALAEHRPYVTKYRILHAEGGVHWVEERGRGIYSCDHQQLLFVDGVLVDITANKSSESALALQSNLQVQNAVICIDRLGRVTYWNHFAEILFQWTAAETIGQAVVELLIPADQQQDGAELLAHLSTVEGWQGELWVQRKDRSRFIAGATKSYLRDSAGKVTGMISTIIDITPQKQAELALQASEERQRLLVNNIPGYVFQCALDHSWKATYLSDQFTAITGYPVEEFLYEPTRSFSSIIHPDDCEAVWQVVETALKQAQPYTVEYRIRHQDGSTHWLLENGQGCFGPSGEALSVDGVVVDITDRKNAELALQEQSIRENQLLLKLSQELQERNRTEAQLQNALQEKITLLQEVHHRVKNNLQILYSLLSLQADSVADQQVQAALADSQNRVMSMSLVHQSLYQTGNFAEVDLKQYAQSLVSQLLGIFGVSRVQHQVSSSGQTNLPLNKAIPCGLLLNELLTNAIKHGLQAQPSIGQPTAGTLLVCLERPTETLMMLEVTNTGHALPENFLSETRQTMGVQLLRLLTEQLFGRLEIVSHQPTRLRVSFDPTH